jgi:hypothetical protein
MLADDVDRGAMTYIESEFNLPMKNEALLRRQYRNATGGTGASTSQVLVNRLSNLYGPLVLHSAGRRANIGVISWALWRLFGHFRLKN